MVPAALTVPGSWRARPSTGFKTNKAMAAGLRSQLVRDLTRDRDDALPFWKSHHFKLKAGDPLFAFASVSAAPFNCVSTDFLLGIR